MLLYFYLPKIMNALLLIEFFRLVYCYLYLKHLNTVPITYQYNGQNS